MLSQGSIRIARLFDIPVKVHWTFLLLLVGVVFIGLSNGLTIAGTGWFLLFVMILFVCVVLHEFGHALTARIFGVPTQDIILSPIGGVARLTKMPDKPIHELLIAIAGPMVNVIIAICIAVYLWLTRADPFTIHGEEMDAFVHAANFLPLIMVINITLVLFNMIPAFPMDGGRVLRALLSMKLRRVRATQIAAFLGKVFAVGFVILGLWQGQFVLPFIGVFIFMAATSEYKAVKMEDLLRDKILDNVYRDQYTLLYEFESMAHALDRMQRTMEEYFLVTDVMGHISGVLEKAAILQAAEDQNLDAFVRDYQQSRFEAFDVHYPLKHLIAIFQHKEYVIIPVYRQGQLVGVIDRNMLHKLLNS